MQNRKVVYEVEFETRQVRKITVVCPKCGKKFYPEQIRDDGRDDFLLNEVDYCFVHYECPICHEQFGYNTNNGYYDSKDEFVFNETSDPLSGVIEKHVHTEWK